MKALFLPLAAVSIAVAQMALSPAMAANLCANRTVPAPAAALGYTVPAIDVCPTSTDISPDGDGRFKLYNGHWWEAKRASLKTYDTAAEGLLIGLHGALTTVSPHGNLPGALPTLAGDRGFYVEFDAYLTGNDPDHFPALWLLPREHNGAKEDSYAGDSPGFERWMEIDVDEGGYAPGWLGTVHNWSGSWPHFTRQRNPYSARVPDLDRSRPHVFAAAFEPKSLKVTWWLDGERMNEAGPPFVPEIARKQNFYMIISAQSHGKNLPYDMILRRFRAFVPPIAPS
jgi:hypothetical protein